MRRRHLPSILAVLFFVTGSAKAQFAVTGEASVNLLDASGSFTARLPNGGNPSFGWRLDLFGDAIVSDNVSFISNLRVFQNEDPAFDFLAVRVTDIIPVLLNLQVGKFDLPFGNLGERRFNSRNPLYSLPMLYEYGTALSATPVTLQDVLARRGGGTGMRLLDFGMYDIGAMIYGSWGPVGYAVAVSNGTVSATSGRLQNTNADFGKVVRLTWTPMQEIVLGASGAWGAYPTPGTTPSTYPDDPVISTAGSEQQRTAEADIEFNTGHLSVFAQGVYGSWDVPFETRPGERDLSMIGWYGEVKYTFMPRLFGAVRASGLRFSDVEYQGATYRWDRNVQEYEAGIGYAFARNVLSKLVYRHTFPNGGGGPQANLAVTQIVVRF
jgi:hypothetical protein